MADRPGIMLYFDLIEALEDLSFEDKGKLLDAMLNYGLYGEVPNLTGGTKIAWKFIRPRLDADAERYEKRVVKNTYSSYCAKAKRNGEEPLDFDEWQAIRCRSMSNGIERHPTTTTTTATTTTQLQSQHQPERSEAATAATYEDKEERVAFLRRMLNLYRCETLRDPETQAMYQAELDSLLQEDTE